MEHSWNVKTLRISLPNHQKYHFCVIKRTGCRNLSAFPDRLVVDISQMMSSQQSPQWSAFRPWRSHLAWLKWDLHCKLTLDFWCLHWYCAHIGSWVLGPYLCAAGSLPTAGLFPVGLQSSAMLSTLGEALKSEALGDYARILKRYVGISQWECRSQMFACCLLTLALSSEK